MSKKNKRATVPLVPQHHNPLPAVHTESWKSDEIIETIPKAEQKQPMFKVLKLEPLPPAPQTDPGLPPLYLLYIVMMTTGGSIGLGFLGVHFFSESGIAWTWFLIPLLMIVIGYILWRKNKDTN